MEIYRDDDLPATTPQNRSQQILRRRKVSFGKSTTRTFGLKGDNNVSRKPLTPHNKNRKIKTVDSEKYSTRKKTNKHFQKSHTAVLNGKENQISNNSSTEQSSSITTALLTPMKNTNENAGITSFRRSLRDTMLSPSSSGRKLQKSTEVTPANQLQPSSLLIDLSNVSTEKRNNTTTANTVTSHVLTPAHRLNSDSSSGNNQKRSSLSSLARKKANLGFPQRILPQQQKPPPQPCTPNSLLKTEMNMLAADESLLVSPQGAYMDALSMIADVDSAKKTMSPSFLDNCSVADSEINKNNSNNKGILRAEVDTTTFSSARADAKKVVKFKNYEEKKAELIDEEKRYPPKRLNTNAEEDAENYYDNEHNLPFESRGNGIQLDLSSMFSEIGNDESLNNSTPLPKARVPIAQLANFQDGLWMDFGEEKENIVGKSRSLPIILEAPPNAGDAYTVEVEKVPIKKGIKLDLGDDTEVVQSFKLKAGEKKQMGITWTPLEEGGVREIINLKLPRGRLQIAVHGRARIVKKLKKSKKGQPTCRVKRYLVDAANATPASKSSTMHVTPSRFATPKGIASNANTTVLDPKIAEMQCGVFANWLNYIFNPSEDTDHDTNANSYNKLALRTLIVHRRMAQTRMRAVDLFRTPKMVNAAKAIDAEVTRGRLSLRPERDIYADLTLRGKILSLLLSYSTPWLRIGLETIFCENIYPENLTNNAFTPQKKEVAKRKTPKTTKNKASLSRMKTTLKNFIINRLLMDKEILKKYTKGKCKMPSGKFEKKFRAETRRVVLSRIIVLIVFLDRAKQANVIENAPHLFVRDSEVKSSREVLVSFCRDFLSSEGDVIKHLTRIGVKVGYKQVPVDEIDFTINNFAVDLRDGIRLARMAEILQEEEPKSLLLKLRLPAISRLQKLHNVGAVLDSLRSKGAPIPNDIGAHHIVDGHREMVLKLMWSVVCYFKLDSLLNAKELENEIQNVLRANKSRKNFIEGFDQQLDGSDDDCEKLESASCNEQQRLQLLLLRWCQAVCSCFGIPISNFTTSFADGRAMCLLLHYYHPSLLKQSEISSTTKKLPKIVRKDDPTYQKALARERQNAVLASTRMADLGGIPRMLPITDSENVADEKAMVLCLSYLCTRLMESSKENLATIVIQNYYRRYQRIVALRRKQTAAMVIIRTWREYKEQYFSSQKRKYLGAVRTIEDFVSRFAVALKDLRTERLEREKQTKAALKIQTCIRMHLAVKKFGPILIQHIAAKSIQKGWRNFAARTNHHVLKESQHAAITLQRFWRGYKCRIEYLIKQYSVLKLQSIVRGHITRASKHVLNHAATSIQRIWRGFLDQVRFQMDLIDIITVQGLVRRRAAIAAAKRRVAAVITLQQALRCFLAKCRIQIKRADEHQSKKELAAAVICQRALRCHFALLHEKVRQKQLVSTTLIQTKWRAYSAQKEYSMKKASVVATQAFLRGYQIRKQLRVRRIAATRIQKIWRTFRDAEKYRVSLGSIILVQSFARRLAATNAAIRRKSAIMVLQSAGRCHLALQFAREKRKEKEGALRLSSAIICQSVVRRYLAVCRFEFLLKRSKSAISIQCFWRQKIARGHFSLVKSASIIIQSIHRGISDRQKIVTFKSSATIIQSAWRTYWAKLQYQLDVLEIIIVQSVFRRNTAISKANKRKYAVSLLQSSIRNWISRLHESRARAVELQETKAATCIRACWLKHRDMVTFKSTRLCVVKIQALVRGNIYRRALEESHSAAVEIQRSWRRFRAATKYDRTLKAVLCVQLTFRLWKARNELVCRRDSIVCIQSMVRARLARIRVKSMREEKTKLIRALGNHRRSSATFLQACFRGYVVRRDLFFLKENAISIQKMWRGYNAQLEYQMSLIGIIIAQSIVRGWAARLERRRRKYAIICFQKMTRRIIATRVVQELRVEKRKINERQKASLIIQRYVRGYIARNSFQQEAAARMIQKTWRCYIVHVDYMICMLSAISIQCAFRRFRRNRKQERIARAIATFQAIHRGAMQRKTYIQMKACAVVVQSFVRMAASLSGYKRKREACLTIQKVARGMLVRVDLQLQHFATTEIQRVWRGYQENTDFLIKIVSAIKIQSHIRRSLAVTAADEARRQQFLDYIEYLFLQRTASKIQHAFGAYMYRKEIAANACIIQRVIRRFLANLKFQKSVDSICYFQGVIRGYLVRQRRTERIIVLAKRVKRANANALMNPNMRLGARTLSALTVLQSSSRLSEMMAAVLTLEQCTELSLNCCFAFADARAPEILYSLIRTCNRSLPHVELLYHILRTLANVAQHSILMESIATDDAVDVFIDLIQMFRDKEHVFCLSVHLLDHVVLSDNAFGDRCRAKENLKRLKGVYSLGLRKMSLLSENKRRAILPSQMIKRDPKIRSDDRLLDMKKGMKTLHRIIVDVQESTAPYYLTGR